MSSLPGDDRPEAVKPPAKQLLMIVQDGADPNTLLVLAREGFTDAQLCSLTEAFGAWLRDYRVQRRVRLS